MGLLSWLKKQKKEKEVFNPGDVTDFTATNYERDDHYNERTSKIEKNIKSSQEHNAKCFKCEAISGLNRITLYRVRDGNKKDRRYICKTCLNP